jgi:acyl-CoA synthetase (NDP forming)
MDELDALFQPRSIAIVGVPRGLKMGKLFLTALRDQEFPGEIHPVNPEADEIDGLRAYPSVSAIPGPVDLAIVLVGQSSAFDVVKECAAKGVKGVVLFTAGFKETGTEEGRALEEEMTRVARSAGMRLFGPNCMGLYSPKTGLSFFPELSRESGPVGFISHSGSLANILGRIAPKRGILFSKAISLGNECDLCAADFLAYLGEDEDTRVIGAYIEGIKDGRNFLDALKAASLKKPVVIWKVGLTPEGAGAARSHTGAMTGSREIWDAVVRQTGAVPVVGFEELLDTLTGFSLLPEGLGNRMAVLSGPGGLAVATAEACGNSGLRLAELSSETRSALSRFVPPTGTSLANPIDVGLSASLVMDIYMDAARLLAADPGVDAVVVVGAGLTPESNQLYTDSMIRISRECGKPLLVVSIPGFDPALAETFSRSGTPFFETAERAVSVYARVRRRQIRLRGRTA